jgi:hypothetical protein
VIGTPAAPDERRLIPVIIISIADIVATVGSTV